MSKDLKFPDFIALLAKKSKLSENKARKVYDSMVEIISDELRLYGKWKGKNFGRFSTYVYGGYDGHVPTVTGETIKRYIEPRQRIRFKPSESFINIVNGRGVTKNYKRRAKNGQLTTIDKSLEYLKTDNYEQNLLLDIKKIRDKKIEKRQKKFDD